MPEVSEERTFTKAEMIEIATEVAKEAMRSSEVQDRFQEAISPLLKTSFVEGLQFGLKMVEESMHRAKIKADAMQSRPSGEEVFAYLSVSVENMKQVAVNAAK